MENRFFKSALPVWIEGRDKEWNVCAEISYFARDLRSATLTLTGASFYQVYIGDRLIHFGPAKKAFGYAGVDVIALPDIKDDIILIRVAGYYMRCYNGALTSSFVCAEIDEGGQVLAATGKGGFDCRLYCPRMQRVMRYTSQRQFSECYDMRRASLSEKFVVVDPEVSFIKRGVDLPELDYKDARFLEVAPYVPGKELQYPLRDYQVDPSERYPYLFKVCELESQPFVEYLKMIPDYSADCLRGSAGTVEHWDLGKIEAGFITLKVRARTDSRIIAVFGEQNYPDGRPNPIPLNATNAVEWILTPGEHILYSFEPYTVMGLEIMITCGECEIVSVGVTELAYSARKIKNIAIRDRDLALVYKAAVESFRHNAFDIFTDCPSRERGGWLCDSYYEGMAEYYFTGKTTVEDEFLNNYLLGGTNEKYGGMVDMCYPSTTKIYIPQWSLWYILELYDYFTKRGRGERREAFKTQIYTLLDYFKQYENELGLLEKLPGWNFVEWSELNQRVHDVSWPTNMLFSEALKCIGELYDDASLIEKSRRIKETINSMAWNGRMYMDRAMRREDGALENTNELSETTQYYAFRFGLADIDDERCAYLKDMVFNVFGHEDMAQRYPEIEPANAFPGFYIRTELMLRWGMYRELRDYIKHFFLPMAEETGTLWEHKTPGASCDHGFTSYIAIAIEEIEKNL